MHNVKNNNDLYLTLFSVVSQFEIVLQDYFEKDVSYLTTISGDQYLTYSNLGFL